MHGCLIQIIPAVKQCHTPHLCGNLRITNVLSDLTQHQLVRFMGPYFFLGGGAYFLSFPGNSKVHSGLKTTVLRMRQQNPKVNTEAMALELF